MPSSDKCFLAKPIFLLSLRLLQNYPPMVAGVKSNE
jgi:hypothetical protein